MKSEFIELSDEIFQQIGKLITEKYGIRMPLEKKIMFQSRLQRRLRELNIFSFDEYVLKLLNDQLDSSEFSRLIDYISTNKTEFFREIEHFKLMTNQILPDILNARQEPQQLKFWSAGCSSGQEAYSIGITLEEFMRVKGLRFDYSIVATDISIRMLKSAKAAIYPMVQVDDVSMDLKQLYFLKSRSKKDPKVRVVQAIREKVSIAYLNLMDLSYPLNTLYDVIFLRNTLIYFSHEVQLKILVKVINSLNTGGYLFIGHSESLINMQLPLLSIAPSVYVKTNITSL